MFCSRPVRTLRLGLAALVTTVVLGCRPADPAPVAIRLVDRVDAELSRRVLKRLPHALRPTPQQRHAPGLKSMVRMNGPTDLSDSRWSILAPPGSSYEIPIELPARAELRFALGHTLPDGEGAEGAPPVERHPLRFRVAVVDGTDEAVAWSEEVVPAADGRWGDRRLDLAQWGGRRVTLRLEVDGSARDGSEWGAWGHPEVVSGSGPPPGWHVILVSLDTLRADRLGCYGYRERPTSPHLDRFSRAATVFLHPISQAPWTRPAHTAMLTGLYPASRGSLAAPALAESFRRAGYRTDAMSGGGQLDGRFGFSTGFDRFEVFDWVHGPDHVIDTVNGFGVRPHFLFLHTFEPHDPYTDRRFAAELDPGRLPPTFATEDWRRIGPDLTEGEKSYVEALYDGDVAHTDEGLGALFDRLEAAGILDRAIVVITSDHGEEFWEHGSWRHGHSMFDELLRVPLVVRLPPGLVEQLGGEVPRRVEQQVQIVDLYPTLHELAGLDLPAPVQGRSLVPLLAGERLPPAFAFAENTNGFYVESKALRLDGVKLVQSRPKRSWVGNSEAEARSGDALFDLRVDPGETTDVSAEQPELTDSLGEQLRAILTGSDESRLLDEVPEGIDEDLREQLEALGYVDG